MKQFTLSESILRQVLAKYYDDADNLIIVFHNDEMLSDLNTFKYRLFRAECEEGLSAVTESVESLLEEIERGYMLAVSIKSRGGVSTLRHDDDRN